MNATKIPEAIIVGLCLALGALTVAFLCAWPYIRALRP